MAMRKKKTEEQATAALRVSKTVTKTHRQAISLNEDETRQLICDHLNAKYGTTFELHDVTFDMTGYDEESPRFDGISVTRTETEEIEE